MATLTGKPVGRTGYGMMSTLVCKNYVSTLTSTQISHGAKSPFQTRKPSQP